MKNWMRGVVKKSIYFKKKLRVKLENLNNLNSERSNFVQALSYVKKKKKKNV